MNDLYIMIEQHKLHMRFLKEHDRLTKEKKYLIVWKIIDVFELIEGRSEKKKNVVDNNNDVDMRVSYQYN